MLRMKSVRTLAVPQLCGHSLLISALHYIKLSLTVEWTVLPS